MSATEAIQILKQIDLLDEVNSDILYQLQELMNQVQLKTQDKIIQQVTYLESIAIDLPAGTVFSDEDLY